MKLLIFSLLMFISFNSLSKNIEVKNLLELQKANNLAQPGDIIILKNGEWKDVVISLTCNGTEKMPIIFKAKTAGKVMITGKSKLNFGGNFIVVDGLLFKNGFANDNVISFRTDEKQVANHCRVTNAVIDDFNNPNRLKENYWVAFYGKNNRVDHCTFSNKKNIGVLVAVMLEGKINQDNFHQIDHNYFGIRIPLASNAGEIIRIGVSETCEFNSNTQITDNFFEYCDGEAEIISIKSCQNVVRNNLFKECQGSVVFRHGNYNTVENNVFLGNDKEGTGGVRLINKGQMVVNNYFYKCRGVGFRSPLTLMNGVPNSPAIRYVSVSNAVIANNTFNDCSAISFCEGSDAERSETPSKVQFVNNIFYGTKDTLLYYQFDDIKGITFASNLVSNTIKQPLSEGFFKTTLFPNPENPFEMKGDFKNGITLNDSIQKVGVSRLSYGFSNKNGYADLNRLKVIESNATNLCGAKWYKPIKIEQKQVKANCKNVAELTEQLVKNKDSKLFINLTSNEYIFTEPINISGDVIISSSLKTPIKFNLNDLKSTYYFQILAGKSLSINDLKIEFGNANTKIFIISDTTANPNHSSFSIRNSTVEHLNGDFFKASKSSVLDSVVVSNCQFSNISGTVFNFNSETDKKGYYNVENLKINKNVFTNNKGKILSIIRSGKDESTMGPWLILTENKISTCETVNEEPLFFISGINRSFTNNNIFKECNTNKKLFFFEDTVKATHIFSNNKVLKSGEVVVDKYVNLGNNSN